jgi:hypothetical protein
MQFPEYMQTQFPGLCLNPALFYSWTVGMRFELNADHWPNVQWETVLHRATTLYRSVFRPGDIGFVVSGQEWEFEHKKRATRRMPEFRNSVFSLSRKESLGLHGIAGRKRITTYQDRVTTIISTFRWTEIEPMHIGYEQIMRAIMHRDFPSKQPTVGDHVYFVNRSRNIILHMYDDRGLDLIAPEISDLHQIYETHRDWILAFDRPAIDQMFESNQPIPNFDYRRIPRPGD